jgi:hypothetical protein
MSKILEASSKNSQQPSIEKPPAFVPLPSQSELSARGKALRKRCPRSCHAVWQPRPIDRILCGWSLKVM